MELALREKPLIMKLDPVNLAIARVFQSVMFSFVVIQYNYMLNLLDGNLLPVLIFWLKHH